MNSNTQNKKIEAITEKTLVIGIDVGSETHYARAFDHRGIEYSKKPFKFSNDETGFASFKAWILEIKEAREKEKIRNAAMRLEKFSEWINESRGGEHLDKGAFPGLYSGFLGGFFHNHLVTDKHFSVDKKKCIGCKKCEKICPVGDIKCVDGNIPVWQHNDRCMTCYACLHHCPSNAISWGWFTSGKGQYVKN